MTVGNGRDETRWACRRPPGFDRHAWRDGPLQVAFREIMGSRAASQG